MNNYKIGLFGNIGVRPMEIDDKFMSDQFAIDWVERHMKYYYPVFYNASLWRMGTEPVLIAQFNAQIAVTKLGANYRPDPICQALNEGDGVYRP